MMVPRTFAVVVVLALAIGVVVPIGSPAVQVQPPEDSTATPTQTETPPAEAELAPGVTREGLVNPVRLVTAHERALVDQGYVLTESVTSRNNGTVSNRLALQTQAGPEGTLALMNATSVYRDGNDTEQIITNDVWLNATTMVSRHVEGGQPDYEVRPRPYSAEAFLWFGGLQQDILYNARSFELTNDTTVDGVRMLTLRATVDQVGRDGVPDTNITLHVTGDGVVTYATRNTSYGGGDTYHRVYNVTRLVAESPDRPAWVETIPPSSSLVLELDIFSFDETSIELVHLYGDAVPTGSTITVSGNGSTYETTLEEPFANGQRNLWLDTNGSLHATAAQPSPGEARILPEAVTVTVTAPDGGVLFQSSVGR